MPHFKRKWLSALAACLIACLSGIAVLWYCRSSVLPYVAQEPSELINNLNNTGAVIKSRNQKVLRYLPDKNGDLSHFTPIASHSKHIINAILTAEDRAFFKHSGFNLKAIARASWQNIRHRRVISGASTITQQLARLSNPADRTLKTKILELLNAVHLEDHYCKEKILEVYINSVSLIGNIRGASLASKVLFNRHPSRVSLAQAATLAALIQAPSRLSPFTNKGNQALLRRRNWILKEMYNLGYCDKSEYQQALIERLPTRRNRLPVRAGHFCDWITKINPEFTGTVLTTIDTQMQTFLQLTTSAHINAVREKGAAQISAVILCANNLEILAMTGSAEYGPVGRGYNNGVIARRSGGSILKPFLYSLAFDRNFWPAQITPDTLENYTTPHGDYIPANANRKAYGPVSLRNALGNSLNISAVKLLKELGTDNFYHLLNDLKILKQDNRCAQHFGLGLAIGNSEVRLLDVATAFGVFVNEGTLKSLKYLKGQSQNSMRIFSNESAYMTFDILSDPRARLLTFGNPSYFNFNQPIALKTGTSTNYRDSWLVAANKDYIVGIWIGNFCGSPTNGLTGATAAGPILKDIFDELLRGKPVRTVLPPDGIKTAKLCSVSGQRPGKGCLSIKKDYIKSNQILENCKIHQPDKLKHNLSAEYASWINERRKTISIDNFSFPVKLGDPYEIPGISKQNPQNETTKNNRISVGRNNISDGHVRIVSPHNGDRFVFSTVMPTYAHLRAIPESPAKEVQWIINGREIIATPPPYEAHIPLEPGVYRINAIAENMSSDEIVIRVER